MKKIWSILLMILLLAYMPKLTASAEGENLISASPKGGSDVWCEYGGETVLELQIEAKDETKLSYQWSYEVWSDIGFYMFKDIEGATDNTYVIENCNDFQTYRCTVTDEYGEFEFVDFFVRVNNEFEVKAGDSSYNVTLVKVAPNTSAELEVHVSSKYEGANKCRWVYYDINNECWDVAMGNDIYKITTDLITREERYYCIVEDKFGNKGTAYFYVQPDNQLKFLDGVNNSINVMSGGTALLKAEVSAYDTHGIEYKWYKRVKTLEVDSEEVRVLIEGASEDTLEIQDVEEKQQYVCVVTDSYGGRIEKRFEINILTEEELKKDEIVVSIDEESFPDERFREYIKSYADSNYDGKLSNGEISRLDFINVNGKGIGSLQGIEYLTSLEYLYCTNNEICFLDVSSNKKLKRLGCDRNQNRLEWGMETLILGDNENLEYLKCDKSNIKNLDISGCPKLIEVFQTGEYIYSGYDYWNTNIAYKLNDDHMLTFDDAITSITCDDVAYCYLIPDVYDTSYVNEEAGEVRGGGCYQKGEKATLLAIPKDGYEFVGWYEGTERKRIIAYDKTLTFTVKSSRKIAAIFKEKEDQVSEETFEDIRDGDWYKGVVQYVSQSNIMAGKNVNGMKFFAPNDHITRAEFATVLYNMQNKPRVSYTNYFSDVPQGKWFSDPIIWTYEMGMAKGYGNTGKFGTSDDITREQMAQMLYSYCKMLGYDNQSDTEALEGFADVDQISSWALPAMQWATYQGIMKGSNEITPRLNPQGKATRAECAAMIKNLNVEVSKYIR